VLDVHNLEGYSAHLFANLLHFARISIPRWASFLKEALSTNLPGLTLCPLLVQKAKAALFGILSESSVVVIEVPTLAHCMRSPCVNILQCTWQNLRGGTLHDCFLAAQLDQRGDGDAIQDALLEITGRRSVPQVFIGGNETTCV